MDLVLNISVSNPVVQNIIAADFPLLSDEKNLVGSLYFIVSSFFDLL